MRLALQSADSLAPTDISVTTAAQRLRAQAAYAASVPVPQLEGRGVVIPAGGNYTASAWVGINMLRYQGCTLPVQVWHLGPEEMPAAARAAFEAIGVELVDAREVQKLFPHPRLNGWEIKAYALLHSGFREVLFLDADNLALFDPTSLFDMPEYQATGALFWPDRGRWPENSPIWQITGLPYQDEAEFESGQMVIDKQRCWHEVVLANEINKDSAFWFQHIHGDKDTFRFAWRLLDRAYTMFPHPSSCHPSSPASWGAFCQKNMDGEPIFWHGHKWKLPAAQNSPFAPNNPAKKYAKECLLFIQQYEAALAGKEMATVLADVDANVAASAQHDELDFSAIVTQIGANKNWAIDERHARWVYHVLRLAKPNAVIEIGSGVTTLTTLQAMAKQYVQTAHVIDPNIGQKIRELAGPDMHFYAAFSTTALPEIVAGDDTAVIIDGDHSYTAVAAELPLVLAHNPRIIIAHDVTSTVGGYENCEGPAWLWGELQSQGWFCFVDSLRRFEEFTHRGLLIATRDMATADAIRQGYNLTCLS